MVVPMRMPVFVAMLVRVLVRMAVPVGMVVFIMHYLSLLQINYYLIILLISS